MWSQLEDCGFWLGSSPGHMGSSPGCMGSSPNQGLGWVWVWAHGFKSQSEVQDFREQPAGYWRSERELSQYFHHPLRPLGACWGARSEGLPSEALSGRAAFSSCGGPEARPCALPKQSFLISSTPPPQPRPFLAILSFLSFPSFFFSRCGSVLPGYCCLIYIFFSDNFLYFSNFILFFILCYRSAPFSLFPPPLFFCAVVVLFYLVIVVSLIFLFFPIYFLLF